MRSEPPGDDGSRHEPHPEPTREPHSEPTREVAAEGPAGAGLEPTESALGFDETVRARRPRRAWRWILTGLFLLLFAIALAGAVLWATDYKVTADIEQTRCDASQVTVRTRQFGLEHTVTDVPLAECLLLEPGDYVEYRIRSQRTTLYDSAGQCVHDSVTGPC